MIRMRAPWTVLASALAVLGVVTVASAITLTPVLSLYTDEKGAPLKEPRGVACDADSMLIVADTGNHRLVRYTLEKRTVKGGTPIKATQISNPLRVKLNSRKEILVLDGKQRKIVRLSRNGKFVGYVEATGLPKSTPLEPVSFDVGRDDNIYLLDARFRRVAVLNDTGRLLRTIPLPGGFSVFTDLAVDAKGTVFALDTANATVHYAMKEASAFSPLTESMTDLMDFPTTIATDSRGLLYVVDQNGSSVVILAQQDGSFQGRGLGRGWEEGRLRYPSDFCVNAKGEAFIADRANSRVQIVTVVR